MLASIFVISSILLAALGAQVHESFEGTQQTKNEGPTLRVEEVVLSGNRVFSDEELRRQLQLTGDHGFWRAIMGRNIYTPERWQTDAARMMQYMADRGYLKASVGEPKIEYINPGDETRREGDVPVRLVITIN